MSLTSGGEFMSFTEQCFDCLLGQVHMTRRDRQRNGPMRVHLVLLEDYVGGPLGDRVGRVGGDHQETAAAPTGADLRHWIVGAHASVTVGIWIQPRPEEVQALRRPVSNWKTVVSLGNFENPCTLLVIPCYSLFSCSFL